MITTFWRKRRTVVLIAALACTQAAQAHDRVSETVHNLSVGGPGQLRAAEESQVCVFCHSSHKTQGVSPLWNRALSPASYTIYDSSTFDADPGQPTGASKLCLSCHDGTIALGSVLSRSDQIAMAGGQYIPSGLTNLGTDKSGSGPVLVDGKSYGPGLEAGASSRFTVGRSRDREAMAAIWFCSSVVSDMIPPGTTCTAW